MREEPQSSRCGEDSSLAIKGRSSGTRTSQVRATEIADSEVAAAQVPKADADSKLRAVNYTNRRRLATFEAIRGLVEPIAPSGLRSGIRSSRTAFNSDL